MDVRWSERNSLTRRLSLVLMAFGVVLALLPSTALGGWTWCRTDPIVTVAGTTQFTINVAVDSAEVAHVNGATAYTLKLATRVGHVTNRAGAGFNGYGDTITWPGGGTSGTLHISVVIPTDNGAQPAQLSVRKGDGPIVYYDGTTASLSADVTYP